MIVMKRFLLYSPLNQGLKQRIHHSTCIGQSEFLLYSPLNQGLKPHECAHSTGTEKVFTLQSIKSRIETKHYRSNSPIKSGFYSTVH